MTIPTRNEFSITSSTADDVWHPDRGEQAYEWWYFDALSDDGRDAVVVIFFDNFIFSPRYNKTCASFPSETSETSKTSETSETERFPAIAFFYYRDGRPVYRCINEFDPDEFSASSEEPRCRVGDSEFFIGKAPYGPGYAVKVRGVLRGGRRISADFEWIAIESDLKLGENQSGSEVLHNWNLAVPRADVSGKISVESRSGSTLESIDFRGTGYHDHNYDSRWLPDAVSEWQWGRAHFNDTTAVYYDYVGQSGERITRLITSQDGTACCEEATVIEKSSKRDVFGLSYPHSLTFETPQGTLLTVSNNSPADSSFFYLRHINDALITLPDGSNQKGMAMSERLAPHALRYRWLDWLIDMRIGRDGKGAFLP